MVRGHFLDGWFVMCPSPSVDVNLLLSMNVAVVICLVLSVCLSVCPGACLNPS